MRLNELLDIHVFDHMNLYGKKVLITDYIDYSFSIENIKNHLPLKGTVISIVHLYGGDDNCFYTIETSIKPMNCSRKEFKLLNET